MADCISLSCRERSTSITGACNVIFRRKVMARSLKNKDLKDWHNHPKMGRQVDEATPFITFKVPIGRQNGTTYSWGIPNLLRACREDLGSDLGMVIDLCNTDKWYDPRELQRAGVRHVKIPIQGKKVHESITNQLFSLHIADSL